MSRKQKKMHDIFLLLLEVSKIDSWQTIQTLFSAAMQKVWSGLILSFSNERADDGAVYFELTSTKNHFGYFRVTGDATPLTAEDQSDIFNISQMLVLALENRQQSKELIFYKNHLEESIHERTFEYLAAKNEADLANHSKNLFLASISHELRTPLTAIIGFSDLLQKSFPQNDKRHIDIISQRGRDLLGLINEILDFARIESSKIELQKAAFPLRELIGDVVESFSAKIHDKQLCLTTKLDPSLSDYYIGDAARISQIMANLLTNAIKYTEVGDIKVHVYRCTTRDCGDDGVMLVVSDTGSGIDNRVLPRIFEPFAWDGEEFLRKQDGARLGLAIVKGLVDRMSGKIEVESKLGQGATFKVFIPLQATDERNLDITDCSLPLVKFGSPAAQKKLILFLTNDHESIELIRSYLDRHIYRIEVTSSLKDAEKLIAAESYQLVLVDLNTLDATNDSGSIDGLNAHLSKLTVVGISQFIPNEKDRLITSPIKLNAIIVKPITKEQINKIRSKVDL